MLHDDMLKNYTRVQELIRIVAIGYPGQYLMRTRIASRPADYKSRAQVQRFNNAICLRIGSAQQNQSDISNHVREIFARFSLAQARQIAIQPSRLQ